MTFTKLYNMNLNNEINNCQKPSHRQYFCQNLIIRQLNKVRIF